MAGSGVGRGRGWLNISKNANLMQPGVIVNNSEPPHKSDKSKVFSALELFDVNDDGIESNKKVKYFLECFEEECHSSEEVMEMLKNIHLKCLHDSQLAAKLVTIASFHSFREVAFHSVRLRSHIIKLLQNDFENSKQVQETDPECFRVVVGMLGIFYSKFKNSVGTRVDVFAAPLLRYLEMLLESAQAEDFEVFVVQLFLNGKEIKSLYPERFRDLMIKVRTLLATDTQITKESKLWLLLALDVETHRCSLLTPELQKFYQEHLGDKAMKNIQISPDPLRVEITYSNKTLDSYQSSVNVLQVSPPSSEELTQSDIVQFRDNGDDTKSIANSFSKNSAASSGNFGRPILGVGAGLLKDTSSKKKISNNNNKLNNRTKNLRDEGREIHKKKQNSKPKGYEHDDRFETTYDTNF